MTVEEIFSRLMAHMKKGLEVHDQFTIIFKYLNLRGYSKCQEYHYFEENIGYCRLRNFYLQHYNKIIAFENKMDNVDLIPSTWLKYERMAVDTSTKRTAIRDIFKKWVDWETETKLLYESSYKELYNLGEIAAALEVGRFVTDVSQELVRAREKLMDLESYGYDIVEIIDEQERLYNLYVEKIKNIFEDD